MKEGYKTTEFWLAIIAQALPLLGIFGVLGDEAQLAIKENAGIIVGSVSSISTAGYAISRAITKTKSA